MLTFRLRRCNSRRNIKFTIRVCERCGFHGLALLGYERLGYLADGY